MNEGKYMKKALTILLINSVVSFSMAGEYCDVNPTAAEDESREITQRRDVCSQIVVSNGNADELTRASGSLTDLQGLRGTLEVDARFRDRAGNDFDAQFVAPFPETTIDTLSDHLTTAGIEGINTEQMEKHRKTIETEFSKLESLNPPGDARYRDTQSLDAAKAAIILARRNEDQEKLKAAQEKLFRTVVEMVNRTENRSQREILQKQLRKITTASQALNPLIISASEALSEKASALNKEAIETKSKIADWYNKTQPDAEGSALDKASILSDLIMLKSDLISTEQETLRNNIYSQIEASILGKYIESQIAQKCSSGGPSAPVLRNLASQANAIVCDDDSAARLTACGQFEQTAAP
jgi:hypothetical protein